MFLNTYSDVQDDMSLFWEKMSQTNLYHCAAHTFQDPVCVFYLNHTIYSSTENSTNYTRTLLFWHEVDIL